MKELEVPKIVVCTLCLWYFSIRLGFSSMDQVWELHGILDEEDRDVVSNQIPVALLGIELDGKPSNIANGIR